MTGVRPFYRVHDCVMPKREAALAFAVRAGCIFLKGTLKTLLRKLLLPASLLYSSLGFAQYGVDGPQPGAPTFKDMDIRMLGVNLTVPLVNKAGIGLPFEADLVFNNNFWFPLSVNNPQTGVTTTWAPNQNFGWTNTQATTTSTGFSYQVPILRNGTVAGYFLTTFGTCEEYTYPGHVDGGPLNDIIVTGYVDPGGAAHEFGPYALFSKTGYTCTGVPATVTGATVTLNDGSGLVVTLVGGGAGIYSGYVTEPNGTVS